MKAIVFDMDGVLVDVSASYRAAIQKTAEFFLGRPVDPSIIQRLKNKSGNNDDYDLTLKIIQLGGKNPEPVEVERKFELFYWGNKNDGFVRNERWLFDYGALKKIYARYKLGIVTGRPKKDADFALKQFTARNFFDIVVCAEDVGDRKKPNPCGLRLALRHFSTKDAVYVGDNVDDMAMAVTAGIPAIGVAKDDGLKSLLMEHGAIEVIESVNELPAILEKK
ncbi:HAD family hydrolase [Candidatus Woesearchaeota archaeon]|nr:HAD family hydrolase [Candidatus Woesearchaeota archaeon]